VWSQHHPDFLLSIFLSLPKGLLLLIESALDKRPDVFSPFCRAFDSLLCGKRIPVTDPIVLFLTKLVALLGS
jgi:hypothetical protein